MSLLWLAFIVGAEIRGRKFNTVIFLAGLVIISGLFFSAYATDCDDALSEVTRKGVLVRRFLFLVQFGKIRRLEFEYFS